MVIVHTKCSFWIYPPQQILFNGSKLIDQIFIIEPKFFQKNYKVIGSHENWNGNI